MRKLGLIFVVVTQILVLEGMALWSEDPSPQANPLEYKIQRGVKVNDDKSEKIGNEVVGGSTGSSSQEEGESKEEAAEGPDIRRLGKHHSTDKSVAGGGVILGGLVTAIFAAVFCYIRVTRKRDGGH